MTRLVIVTLIVVVANTAQLFAQKYSLVSLHSEFEGTEKGTFLIHQEQQALVEISIKGVDDKFMVAIKNLDANAIYFDLQSSKVIFDEVPFDFATLVKEHGLQASPDLMASLENGVSGIFHHIASGDTYKFLISTWAFPQIHDYLAFQASSLKHKSAEELKQESLLSLEWVFYQEKSMTFSSPVWAGEMVKKQKLNANDWLATKEDLDTSASKYQYAFKNSLPVITLFAALPLLWLISIGVDK